MKLFGKIPVWGWVTIGSVILLLAIIDTALEEPVPPQSCYFDVYGNWVCQ